MRDSTRNKQPAYAKTIVLVGMMGAGKTTIGRRLAARVNLPFFDVDAEIEKASGMPVSELFQRHGEKSFRAGEARVIARLLKKPPHILSTGGGAFVHPKTRRLIAEKAISIWLKADINVLARRAAKRGGRPLLETGDPKNILANLLTEREVYYVQADLHIDSLPGPHSQTVNLIIEKLNTFLSEAAYDNKGGYGS